MQGFRLAHSPALMADRRRLWGARSNTPLRPTHGPPQPVHPSRDSRIVLAPSLPRSHRSGQGTSTTHYENVCRYRPVVYTPEPRCAPAGVACSRVRGMRKTAPASGSGR